MNSSRLPIFLLVLLCSLSACDLLPSTLSPPQATLLPSPTSLPEPIQPTALPAPIVVPVEISEILSDPPLTITARFPRIDAPGDARYAALNRASEALVRDAVKSFRDDVTNPAFKPEPSVPGSFIEVTYDVLFGANGLVSYLFTMHYYLSGAAHPNQASFSLNYDLSRGKILALTDIFVSNSNYLAALVDYSLMDLKRQKVLEWGENLTASQDSFQAWNIQPDGLRITFDPYIVAPYAMGPQKVLIPFSALKDYIVPTGPLAPLVK